METQFAVKELEEKNTFEGEENVKTSNTRQITMDVEPEIDLVGKTLEVTTSEHEVTVDEQEKAACVTGPTEVSARRSSRTPKKPKDIYQEAEIHKSPRNLSKSSVSSHHGNTSRQSHNGQKNTKTASFAKNTTSKVSDDIGMSLSDELHVNGPFSSLASTNREIMYKFPIVEAYFYNRLQQIVIFLGGTTISLDNWTVQVIKRSGGLSEGIIDVYYYSAKDKKYRNRVEVAASLGLMPPITQIRNSTRDQHFIVAMENRERFLVSHMLGVFANNENYPIASSAATTVQCTKTKSIITGSSNDLTSSSVNHQQQTLDKSVEVNSSVTEPVPYSTDVDVVTGANNTMVISSDAEVAIKTSQHEIVNGSKDTDKKATLISPLESYYDHISYIKDQIVLYKKNEIVAISNGECKTDIENDLEDNKETYISAVPSECNFTIGNCTVLNWGEISLVDTFHSHLQLFPIGFKCLRQEHDLALDRPVDVLLEIEKAVGTLNELPVEFPLFRITVHWEIPVYTTTTVETVTVNSSEEAPNRSIENNVGIESGVNAMGTPSKYEKVVKVYEALSPQQAWQAALLETIGLSEDTTFPVSGNPFDEPVDNTSEIELLINQAKATTILPSTVTKNSSSNNLVTKTQSSSSTTPFASIMCYSSDMLHPTSNANSTSVSANKITDDDEITPDDEESILRATIREYRKNYFRALRIEQKMGHCPAVKPRLDIDSIDCFNDDIILRMIEGMNGVSECNNYHFISSREKDGGRKEQFNGLARLMSKAKNCERLFIRNHKLLMQTNGDLSGMYYDYDDNESITQHGVKIPRVQKLNPSVILAMAKAKKRKHSEVTAGNDRKQMSPGTFKNAMRNSKKFRAMTHAHKMISIGMAMIGLEPGSGIMPGMSLPPEMMGMDLNGLSSSMFGMSDLSLEEHGYSGAHPRGYKQTSGGSSFPGSPAGEQYRKNKFSKSGKKRRSGGPGSRGGKIKHKFDEVVTEVIVNGVIVKRRRKRRSPAAMAIAAAEAAAMAAISLDAAMTQSMNNTAVSNSMYLSGTASFDREILLTKAQQRAKIRDVDRAVKMIKENVIKLTKKRRDEVKLRLEMLSDFEESGKTILFDTKTVVNRSATNVSESALYSSSQPLPIAHATGLSNKIFGQLLELWHILNTYSTPLSSYCQFDSTILPSLAEWIQVLQFCDKRYKCINEHSPPYGYRGETPSCTSFYSAFHHETTGYKHIHLSNVPTYDSTSGSIAVDGKEEQNANIASLSTIIDSNTSKLGKATDSMAGFLDKLGMELCKPLLNEFIRVLGVDASAASASSSVTPTVEDVIPCNILTWKEIYRMVLFSTVCRDINISDVDINTSLKGKPYNQYVDATDKFYLRLIRSRMMHSYTMRHEDQEALNGFRSGICVRIPAPSVCTKNYMALDQLLSSLQAVPDIDTWLIVEIIQRAILWCEYYFPAENNTVSKDIQTRLKSIIYGTSNSNVAENGVTTLIVAGKESYGIGTRCTSEVSVLVTSEDGMKCKKRVEELLQFIDMSNFNVDDIDVEEESSDIEVNDEQEDSENKNIKQNKKNQKSITSVNIEELTKSNTLKNELGEKNEQNSYSDFSIEPSSLYAQRQRQKAFMSMRFAVVEEEFLLSYAFSLESKTPQNATVGGGINSSEGVDNVNMMDVDESRVSDANNNDDAATEYMDRSNTPINLPSSASEPNLLSLSATATNGDKAKQSSSGTLSNDIKPFSYYTDDAELASGLSIAMQRCYIVLRDLMFHPYSDPFIYPVDKKLIPQYYNSVAQPISLIEIRRYLVKGGYENNIFQFYSDMCLLFDNAFLYNLDSTVTFRQAHKLLFVFERMFLETVLEIEDPLCVQEACIACNSLEVPANNNKNVDNVTCERCSAFYHVACLSPSDKILSPLSGGKEWICPCCIEQKGISSVHPNKLAIVRHPSYPSSVTGQVVAIEQKKNTLVFVIEFGVTRELWSGKKVREYCIGNNLSSHNKPSASPNQSAVLELPSGYNYDDYDAVCGFARGYSGWGQSHLLDSLLLSDTHSLPACQRSANDSYFTLHSTVLGILSSSAYNESEDLSSLEWLFLLRSLAQRVVTIPLIVLTTAKYDSEVELLTITTSNTLPAYFSLPENYNSEYILKSNIMISASAADDTSNNNSSNNNNTFLSKKRLSLTDIVEKENKSDTINLKSMKIETTTSGDETVQVVTNPTLDINTSDSDFSHIEEKDDTLQVDVEDQVMEVEEDQDEVEVEEDAFTWEFRKLSRRRGREDALATYEILTDALKELSTSIPTTSSTTDGIIVTSAKSVHVAGNVTSSNTAEETESMVDYLAGFSVGVLKSFVNQNINQQQQLNDTSTGSGASVDPDEWEKAYMLQFEYLETSLLSTANIGNKSSTDSSSLAVSNTTCNSVETVKLCQYCGFLESQLSSSFVWGQTFAEWEIEFHESKDSFSASYSTIKEANNNRKWCWLPVDNKFTDIELKECYRYNKIITQQASSAAASANTSTKPISVHKGSLVVHEYCAQAMWNFRYHTYDRLVRFMNQKYLDMVVSNTRCKMSPLGQDKRGNLYWHFADLPNLLFINLPSYEISSKTNSTTTTAAAASTDTIYNPFLPYLPNNTEIHGNNNNNNNSLLQFNLPLRVKISTPNPNIVADNADTLNASGISNDDNESFNTNFKQKDVTETYWCYYDCSNYDEIHKLLLSLSDNHCYEKYLKRALLIMYPLAEKANNTPLTITNGTSSEEIPVVKNVATKTEQLPPLLNHSSSGTSISSKNLTSSTSVTVIKFKDGNRSVKLLSNDEDEEWDDNYVPPTPVNEAVTVTVTKDAKNSSNNNSNSKKTSSDNTTSSSSSSSSNKEKTKINSNNMDETLTGHTASTTIDDDNNNDNHDGDHDEGGDDEDEDDDFDSEDDDDFGFGRKFSRTFNMSPNRKMTEQGDISRSSARLKAADTKRVTAIVGLSSEEKKKQFLNRKSKDIGQHVFVMSSRNTIMWRGRIVDLSYCDATQQSLYKIEYENWGPKYKNWVSTSKVQFIPMHKNSSKQQYQHTDIMREEIPEVLHSLLAVKFINEPGRQFNRHSESYSYLKNIITNSNIHDNISAVVTSNVIKKPGSAVGTANSSSTQQAMASSSISSLPDYLFPSSRLCGEINVNIWLLKKALFLLLTALPMGALDKTEEKWGKRDFGNAWREAVVAASDATSLMQCLLFLEYSIKQAWIKPSGVKIFNLLQSSYLDLINMLHDVRCFAIRNATTGMVAMRIWVLDMSIRYEKIEKESARKSSGGGTNSSNNKNDSESNTYYEKPPISKNRRTTTNSSSNNNTTNTTSKNGIGMAKRSSSMSSSMISSSDNNDDDDDTNNSGNADDDDEDQFTPDD